MTTAPAIEPFLEQYYQACEEFIGGNPEPMKRLYTQQDDVSLFYPWGGPALKGHEHLEQGMERSAATYSEGHVIRIERTTQYVTPDLAFLVEVWRFKAKVAGRNELAPGAIRVTQILRPEAGEWRILHRHADTMVSDQLLSPLVAAGS